MNENYSKPQVVTSSTFTLLPVKALDLPAVTSGTALLKDSTLTAPDELIDGLLHKATKAMIVADSKAGKTWLLLHLALCISTGTRFLRWNTTQAKVLFINLEIAPVFIKQRLQGVMTHLGISSAEDLHLWNLRGKVANFEELSGRIIQETKGKGYGLIVIDPIYKALVGRSENSAAGIGALCYRLERLAERSGAAVLYSHHFAKGNSKKKAARDRHAGSGVFTRDADTIVTLSEHAEANCFTVEMILRNFPRQPSFVVQWDHPVMVEREDLDPEDVVVEDVADVDDHGLLDLLRVPQSTWEWELKASELNISRATFYRIKKKLNESGVITFDFSEKKWTLCQK